MNKTITPLGDKKAKVINKMIPLDSKIPNYYQLFKDALSQYQDLNKINANSILYKIVNLNQDQIKDPINKDLLFACELFVFCRCTITIIRQNLCKSFFNSFKKRCNNSKQGITAERR